MWINARCFWLRVPVELGRLSTWKICRARSVLHAAGAFWRRRAGGDRVTAASIGHCAVVNHVAPCQCAMRTGRLAPFIT